MPPVLKPQYSLVGIIADEAAQDAILDQQRRRAGLALVIGPGILEKRVARVAAVNGDRGRDDGLVQVRQGKRGYPLTHVIRFQGMAENFMKQDGSLTGRSTTGTCSIQDSLAAVFLIFNRFADALGQAVQVEFQRLAAPFADLKFLRLVAGLQPGGNAEMAENRSCNSWRCVFWMARRQYLARKAISIPEGRGVEKVGQKAVVGQDISPVSIGQAGGNPAVVVPNFSRPWLWPHPRWNWFPRPGFSSCRQNSGPEPRSFFRGEFAAAAAVQGELHGVAVLVTTAS